MQPACNTCLKLTALGRRYLPMLRFSALLSVVGFAVSLAALLGRAAVGTRRS